MDTIRTRPRIRMEPTPTDRVVEAAALVGLGFAIISVALYWPQIPQRIPTHFDFAGKVDSWGPKLTLIMMPVICAVAYVLLTVVSRFPHAFNYPVPITEENAERQYRIALTAVRWLKMECVWVFAYTNWRTIEIALGRTKGPDPLFLPVFLGAIIATVVTLVVRSYRAR